MQAACPADLTVFGNSSCTGAKENNRPPVLSSLKNRLSIVVILRFFHNPKKSTRRHKFLSNVADSPDCAIFVTFDTIKFSRKTA